MLVTFTIDVKFQVRKLLSLIYACLISFLLKIKEIVMTTITNFIEGNFISNPEQNSSERPIWVLDSNSSFNCRDLVEAFTWKCGQDKK
jgi:hypothetical protein